MKAKKSNVLPFDERKRAAQVINERAARAAIEEFLRLVDCHGCRWVTLGGITQNDEMFSVFSHGASDGSPNLQVLFKKMEPRS